MISIVYLRFRTSSANTDSNMEFKQSMRMSVKKLSEQRRAGRRRGISEGVQHLTWGEVKARQYHLFVTSFPGNE